MQSMIINHASKIGSVAFTGFPSGTKVKRVGISKKIQSGLTNKAMDSVLEILQFSLRNILNARGRTINATGRRTAQTHAPNDAQNSA
mmetsp:Transcript_16887/g.37996  ORF Transcript_16887/g.37996 Transcript_16887/m.37996 type:complete len:87 (-) Transcript_16887:885-1145(-)